MQFLEGKKLKSSRTHVFLLLWYRLMLGLILHFSRLLGTGKFRVCLISYVQFISACVFSLLQGKLRELVSVWHKVLLVTASSLRD